MLKFKNIYKNNHVIFKIKGHERTKKNLIVVQEYLRKLILVNSKHCYIEVKFEITL